MKIYKIFLLTVILGFSQLAYGQSKPKTPPIIIDRIGTYSVLQFDADTMSYNAAVSAKDYDRAKILRDSIAYHFQGNIDFAYGEYKNTLFFGRAKQNFMLDILEEIGVTAIGITRSIRTKDILTAALQGFRGGRKSYDSNFFKSQTISIVITSMDGTRLQMSTTINNNLSKADVLSYPLEKVLSDEIDYFYAGTLQSGLQNLTEQTGAAMQNIRANAAAMQADTLQQQMNTSVAKPKP